MSHSSRDPRGGSSEPQLVSYVRLSSDGSFTFRCTFDCKIGCCGDERCTGIKIPLLAANAPVPPGAMVQSVPQSAQSASQSSLTNNTHSPASVAVIPPRAPAKPTLEINQCLPRDTSPLDPSSPSTRQYMKGKLQLLSNHQYSLLLASEVEEFAQWHAINEKQQVRGRDMSRRSTVRKYKGNFLYGFQILSLLLYI